MRNIVISLLTALLSYPALAQKSIPPSPAQVAQEVRDYRMDNEDRIVRELSEFLAIPNIASDTQNIQKNAAHLVEMLEARYKSRPPRSPALYQRKSKTGGAFFT